MQVSQPPPDTSPVLAASPAQTAPAAVQPVTRHAFDYAVVRVVPRVEREEFINAGAIVHSPALQFLGARVELDRRRLLALAPDLDPEQLDEIERYLQGIVAICAGAPGAGPLARLSISQRFHWLIAPRSHVVQTGPVHAGMCSDPESALEHLVELAVRVPGRPAQRPAPGRIDRPARSG